MKQDKVVAVVIDTYKSQKLLNLATRMIEKCSFIQDIYLIGSIPISNINFIKIDNIIIGSGTLFIEQKFIFNGSKCGHIEDIIVDNMYRNKGYGKMLVEHLIKCAIVQKCYKIVLSCSDDVQEFYTKCGFEKRGNNMSMLLDKMI